jgi:isopenicillin N synthase-like dioxygenase
VHADAPRQGYYIGTDLPSDAPLVQARRFFMGPNVWPPAELLPAPAFRRLAEAYYEAVYALALAVLALIARTLPYGPDVFAAFTAGTPAAPLRLLHYPPAPPPSSAAGPRQLGASAHTDFGAITLLLQDEHAGLEVRDPATGAWVEIPPGGDGYVVNVGDMLRAWTGGAYRSSVHRVINKEPTDRYSVVFFFDGNLDCPLAPLDGGPVDGDVVTVEGHMLRRMAESYGGAKGKRP